MKHYPYHYFFETTRIIDADTFQGIWHYGGKQYRECELRVVGCDAFEKRGPEKQIGMKAIEFTESLIFLNEKTPIISLKDPEDVYGRILAKVLVGDGPDYSDFATLLLKNNLAVPWHSSKQKRVEAKREMALKIHGIKI